MLYCTPIKFAEKTNLESLLAETKFVWTVDLTGVQYICTPPIMDKTIAAVFLIPPKNQYLTMGCISLKFMIFYGKTQHSV